MPVGDGSQDLWQALPVDQIIPHWMILSIPVLLLIIFMTVLPFGRRFR